MQIVIKTLDAHRIFHSMIEGMEEVASESGEADRATDLDALLAATAADASAGRTIFYPISFVIPDSLKELVVDVLENCYDSDAVSFVAGDESALQEGDVVISDNRGRS